MQMKDVIRKKRRECGLTQEQVASYLGVSTPAVNKWESGTTYPDISLLAALARLLKTDLNTLLCFRENLTKEDIAKYVEEITGVARKDGMEQAFMLIQEKVKEYPSCAELLYNMAVLVRGLMIMIPCTEEQIQKSNDYAIELYERVEKCDDSVYVNCARYALASKLIQDEDYENAQQLIDLLPEYDALDKRELQISMHMKRKKNKEAAELLERKLNCSLQEVFLLLNNLATVAVWEEDIERAWKLAEYSQNVMEIYKWKYSTYVVAFSVAMEEKDSDQCIKILEKMLEALSEPWDIGDSILFTHIKKKEAETAIGTKMLKTLLLAIEKDERLEFLRSKQEFRKLMERYCE